MVENAEKWWVPITVGLLIGGSLLGIMYIRDQMTPKKILKRILKR